MGTISNKGSPALTTPPIVSTNLCLIIPLSGDLTLVLFKLSCKEYFRSTSSSYSDVSSNNLVLTSAK